MNFKHLPLAIAISLGAFVGGNALGASTKIEFPAPSPACTIKQRVGLTDIEVVYSRPGVKDRTIFGGLVPYGEVWRTGANAATKITFSTSVKLNGTDVPAGTYALFTIPGEEEWTVIINKGPEQWGAYTYDQKKDLVRFKTKPVDLGFSLETFTIEFNHVRDESALMSLIWDKTVVPIRVEVELTDKLVPQIEAAMAAEGGDKPYYQAAMFYFDHDQDLQKASKWIDAAIAKNDAHYMEYLKAKILAKLGNKTEAVAAAKHSKELAIKAKDNGYIKLNDDLITSLQ